MTEQRISRGGVEIVVDDEGDGPAVLLLHGWPDTAALWGPVGEQLRAAGFRTIAPDQRGCGRSDKPDATDAYKVHELVADAVAVLDGCGVARATVVGHDWGANLAWVLATFLPQRFERVVALSVGHPTAFRSAGLEQQLRSWYTLLFFHEGVGEAFLRQNDHEAMRIWLGHPRADEVIEDLERTGQLSAQLKWYRANIPPSAFVDPPPMLPNVTVPALGIWSSGDAALSEAQMANSAKYCDAGFEMIRLNGFRHWIPLEAPDEVSSAIINFIHH